jgi:hypothetical protein
VKFLGWEGSLSVSGVVWFAHPDPANLYGRGVGMARSLVDEDMVSLNAETSGT